MITDYFITDASTLSPRWQNAFSEVRICSSCAGLPASADGDIRVWILAGAQSDWQERMQDLASRGFMIIAMTRSNDVEELQRCLLAGARGYVEAFANVQVLQQVAQSVTAGAIWLPAIVVGGLLGALDRHLPVKAELDENALERLTSRERDVVEALRTGMTNKQIARTLGISERTVKEHLGAVFAKFGVSDRLQLVLRLNGRGEVPIH